jgi:pimeloyl-ACP methyl ester carboxylesterase
LSRPSSPSTVGSTFLQTTPAGKNDPFFIPPGARAYLNDLPEAKLVWLDAGHVVLDENGPQVAAEIKAVFTA